MLQFMLKPLAHSTKKQSPMAKHGIRWHLAEQLTGAVPIAIASGCDCIAHHIEFLLQPPGQWMLGGDHGSLRGGHRPVHDEQRLRIQRTGLGTLKQIVPDKDERGGCCLFILRRDFLLLQSRHIFRRCDAAQIHQHRLRIGIESAHAHVTVEPCVGSDEQGEIFRAIGFAQRLGEVSGFAPVLSFECFQNWRGSGIVAKRGEVHTWENFRHR